MFYALISLLIIKFYHVKIACYKWYKLRLIMESNIHMRNIIHTYSFNGGHPTHVSSLVDMQLIPPKRFWYLYGLGSFTMSIIVVPRKGWYKLRLTMESNIHMRNIIHTYSFNGGHPTHVPSLVDMQLIPPKRFWYLYGSGSFTMSIIVVPRKGWYCWDLRLEKLSKSLSKIMIVVEGVESKHSTSRKHQEWMISSSILGDPII